MEHKQLCNSFMQKIGLSIQEPNETSITMLSSRAQEQNASNNNDKGLHPVLSKTPGTNHSQILNEVNEDKEDTYIGVMPVWEIKKEMMKAFCGPSLIGGVSLILFIPWINLTQITNR